MCDENEQYTGSSGRKYTKKELELLIYLVEQLTDVIENPKTDATTKVMKDNAWELIAEEYAVNSAEHGIVIERNAVQLKRCWENLKYRCRKADSRRKQLMLKTGGGPSVMEDSEEFVNEQVRRYVPHINFTLENPYDSTSLLEEESSSSSKLLDIEHENLTDDYLEHIENDFNGKDSFISQQSTATFSESMPPANNSAINNSVLKVIQKYGADKRPHEISLAKNSQISRQPLKSTQNLQNVSKSKAMPSSSILGKRLQQMPGNLLDATYKKKGVVTTGSAIEQDVRIKKNEEAAMQQQEIHKAKLVILEKEKDYWNKMQRNAVLKEAVYAAELKAMEAQVSYWERRRDRFNLHSQ